MFISGPVAIDGNFGGTSGLKTPTIFGLPKQEKKQQNRRANVAVTYREGVLLQADTLRLLHRFQANPAMPFAVRPEAWKLLTPVGDYLICPQLTQRILSCGWPGGTAGTDGADDGCFAYWYSSAAHIGGWHLGLPFNYRAPKGVCRGTHPR